MAHTVCELLWLMLQELKVLVEEPMRLYCDNRAASLFFEKIGLQDPAQIAQQAENGKHSTIKPPTKGGKGRTHLACKLAASL